jgi:hypothetical protein
LVAVFSSSMIFFFITLPASPITRHISVIHQEFASEAHCSPD